MRRIALACFLCGLPIWTHRAAAAPNPTKTRLSPHELSIKMSGSEARSMNFFSRPFSPSARSPGLSRWITECTISRGARLALHTHKKKTIEGIFMGVTESEDTLVLGRHGQWENVKFDEIETLILHGEPRPLAGLMTGAFLGSSAGVFLSYESADSQSVSTTFVTSLVTGMLLGLSIGLLMGADTHYFLNPERRRLSPQLKVKWLD